MAYISIQWLQHVFLACRTCLISVPDPVAAGQGGSDTSKTVPLNICCITFSLRNSVLLGGLYSISYLLS